MHYSIKICKNERRIKIYAKNAPHGAFFVIIIFRLCKRRSLNGALACAGAAFDAFIGVDNVLAVLFGNCSDGACVSARAAAEALVGIDDIRHSYFLTRRIFDLKMFTAVKHQ